MERIGYGVGLKLFQILGMVSFVCCAVIVSLSDLFQPKETSTVVEMKISEITTPIHVAVLSSLCMPASCTVFCFLIKYANTNLKLRANDYTAAYWFIMSFVVQIAAIVYFNTSEGSFVLGDWIRGSLGSITNLAGCGFIVAAYGSDGAPYGVITAFV